MTVAIRALARLVGLPPAQTQRTVVERDLRIPMRDGVLLLADRITPRGAGPLPTILLRSPYGRRGLIRAVFGRLLAEQGFNVVVQSVRGTFGSGGTLSPFLERSDGLDTVAWVKRQAWFADGLATIGPSYLSLTQWALAADAGDVLKAAAIQVSASQFHGPTYPGGSYALANMLTWTHLVSNQERRNTLLVAATAQRALRPLFEQLPLGGLDKLATGGTVGFWQDWLAHPEPGDPYWTERSYDQSVRNVTAPVCMTAGWYDIFLPWQLADYAALRAAGASPSLTIGPWEHTSKPLMVHALRDATAHFRTHLLGDSTTLRDFPVRVFVTGARQWRDYPDWPPPQAVAVSWYLHGEARLSPDDPKPSPPDRYRYDPADPTPAVSGPVLARGRSKPTDNRALEARPDVITFTGAPLAFPLEVVGPVSADLYVRSSLEHTDFFVRLCDVYPGGKSVNICDGLLRLRPSTSEGPSTGEGPGTGEAQPDGSLRIIVTMWPVAHRFVAGHRLRIQVSSGAHPRFSRNPGTGEPLAYATALVHADQSVYHDPDHPSAVRLTVLPQ